MGEVDREYGRSAQAVKTEPTSGSTSSDATAATALGRGKRKRTSSTRLKNYETDEAVLTHIQWREEAK